MLGFDIQLEHIIILSLSLKLFLVWKMLFM